MSRSPLIRKLIASLIIVTFAIGFLALVVGSQMVPAQTKVHDLQSQLASYENMANSLQNQANSLQTQIINLQNPIDNVTVAAISVPHWHPDPVTGYPYYKDINITLQNVGTRNIGGVTLDVKLEGNTTNIYLGIHVATTQLGVFHVQESKSLTVRLIAAKEDRQALADCWLRITLMLDKNVLDIRTVTIGD